MTKLATLLILLMMCGCQALSHKEVADPVLLNAQAREALDREEYFRARRLAEKALQEDPGNEESRKLMAAVLEKEIAQQKEAFEERPYEQSPEESKDEVKTLLERAREMFRAKQYEEAMLTAEKVFAYDAENQRASELIDEIRKQVYAEGKQDAVFLKGMYRDEARERILRYRERAAKQIETEQWGAAKLTVEKILLLAPEDKEALKQYELIKQREALNS